MKAIDAICNYGDECYQQGREDALNEALDRIKEYTSVWMSYKDGMTKEEIAHEALKVQSNLWSEYWGK